jgi:hypothetical protein
MAELEGNVLRPPGFGPTVTFDPPEELLASTGHGYIQKGVTLAQNGVYRVGEPVAPTGATDTTGNRLWIKSTRGACHGFVRTAVDTTAEKKLANVVLSGAINVNVQALTAGTYNVTAASELEGNTKLKGKYVDHFAYFVF